LGRRPSYSLDIETEPPGQSRKHQKVSRSPEVIAVAFVTFAILVVGWIVAPSKSVA
jgi:hypothetical protein